MLFYHETLWHGHMAQGEILPHAFSINIVLKAFPNKIQVQLLNHSYGYGYELCYELHDAFESHVTSDKATLHLPYHLLIYLQFTLIQWHNLWFQL